MFDVVVSFLTEFDVYGMLRKVYECEDVYKARELYRAMLDDYASSIEEGTVSVETDAI